MRVRIEWTNEWWQPADNSNIVRWALIGDSVARSYRGVLQEIMSDKIAMDYFGTSIQIDEQWYWQKMQSFFETNGYFYDTVIIHINFHWSFRKEWDDFEFPEKYEKMLQYILPRCNRCIFVGLTHFEMMENGRRVPDRSLNEEVVRRNALIQAVAQKYNVMFVDLYDYFLERKEKFAHVDHLHFEKNAERVYATRILQALGELETVYENHASYLKQPIMLEALIKGEKDIVIYGCGVNGKAIEKYIRSRGGMVKGYVVSDDVDTAQFNVPLPVRHISEVSDEVRTMIIISSIEFMSVYDTLEKMGVEHVRCAPELIRFVKDYNKLEE